MASLASLSTGSQRHRQEHAETVLQQGLNFLLQIQAEGFAQPPRLQQAAAALMDALRSGRTDIRPYLGLAYIFLLLEDTVMAQKYVSQAARVKADDSRVLAFQERVRQVSQTLLERKQALNAGHDYDLLYDACEEKIRALVREVMLSGMLVPSLDTQRCQGLRQRLSQWQKHAQALQVELKVIDEEIEVSPLEQMLRPVHTMMVGQQKVLTVSQEMRDLAERINSDLESVEQISDEARQTQVQEDLPVLEENLEALLDNLDGYAECIEKYQEHWPAEELEAVYTRLREQIETYQDVLEEAQERLL